jgi:hypothetical protein
MRRVPETNAGGLDATHASGVGIDPSGGHSRTLSFASINGHARESFPGCNRARQELRDL